MSNVSRLDSTLVPEVTAFFQVFPQAREYTLERVSISRSDSSVYRLATAGKPMLFLKVSTIEDASDLETERDGLHWLASRAAVPRVLDFVTKDEIAYLLTEALPGTNAAEAPARLSQRPESDLPDSITVIELFVDAPWHGRHPRV